MSARRQKKIAQLDYERVKLGLVRCMETREGRRFIWHLFGMTNILSNAFSEDARVTVFRLGEQNIGQQLLALLEEVDPGAWLALRQEQIAYQNEMDEAKETDNE